MNPYFKLFTGLNGQLVAVQPSKVEAATVRINSNTQEILSIDLILSNGAIQLCPDNHNLQDVMRTLEGD